MSEPFLGEIKIVGFNFAPRGYAFCDGQLLPINQNQSLYSILGTTYGGDGRVSFALPDLRGRAPIHSSTQNRLGAKAGNETHQLTMAEIPSHTHLLSASKNDGTTGSPNGNIWAANSGGTHFGTAVPDGSLSNAALTSSGDSQAHNNMQPYLVVAFVIALQGLFPSRS